MSILIKHIFIARAINFNERSIFQNYKHTMPMYIIKRTKSKKYTKNKKNRQFAELLKNYRATRYHSYEQGIEEGKTLGTTIDQYRLRQNDTKSLPYPQF